jgi:hypothetical protein
MTIPIFLAMGRYCTAASEVIEARGRVAHTKRSGAAKPIYTAELSPSYDLDPPVLRRYVPVLAFVFLYSNLNDILVVVRMCSHLALLARPAFPRT